MTMFDKWCNNNGIDQVPIATKLAVICLLYPDCSGCPLSVFENCYIDNPDVVKWFTEEVFNEKI